MGQKLRNPTLSQQPLLLAEETSYVTKMSDNPFNGSH